jgi:DNA mismatch repair protein MutS2
VFLEPELTLPLGNELADLRLQERDECRRILAELTAGVRASADALTQDQEVLTEIDVLAAIDAWAADFDAVLPRFGERLLLRSCRHPLLERQLRAAGRVAELAPLDLLLPPDARVLLITGPNSGGKTAALKTVGLLALMAQAGLPVPVDPLSEFVCFEQVFADIGDEQSLTRNLSTFTGHLSRIRDVLAGVTHGHSLVLLDELGTGTDPLEGGALACAILNVLAGSGAVTLATSHLSVLKTYVHEQNGMLNAAVRFNVETLTPEYVLDVGRPGASQALTIAAKLGLPEQLLACARELLSSDYLRLENMLAHIEETQRRVSQREREIQEAGQGLAGEREAVRTQLQQLKRERKQLLHDAYQQAAGIVENARQEMDRLLAIARNSAPAAPRVEVCRQAKADLRRRQESLTAGASATAPKPDQPLPIGKLCPGQRVWVEKLRANATIVGIDAGAKRVTVELGALRFTVAAREIGQATGGASGEEAPLRESRPAVGDVQTELKLIGKLVADALPALDQFLNRAAMAALPEVRVIHGFGTGRLRLAVHEFLKQHPLVAGFRLGSGRDPGRGGATLVALKQR